MVRSLRFLTMNLAAEQPEPYISGISCLRYMRFRLLGEQSTPGPHVTRPAPVLQTESDLAGCGAVGKNHNAAHWNLAAFGLKNHNAAHWNLAAFGLKNHNAAHWNLANHAEVVARPSPQASLVC